MNSSGFDDDVASTVGSWVVSLSGDNVEHGVVRTWAVECVVISSLVEIWCS